MQTALPNPAGAAPPCSGQTDRHILFTAKIEDDLNTADAGLNAPRKAEWNEPGAGKKGGALPTATNAENPPL